MDKSKTLQILLFSQEKIRSERHRKQANTTNHANIYLS